MMGMRMGMGLGAPMQVSGTVAGAEPTPMETLLAQSDVCLFNESGFSRAQILDSSGNNNHAISRSVGAILGDGTAYFAVTGLVANDLDIACDSTDKATISDGKIEIANEKIVYGITLTAKAGGAIWAKYPVVEKSGIVLNDVSGNKRHGTLTSGSDSNWTTIDTPDHDYLRDNGCSRVMNFDGVTPAGGTQIDMGTTLIKTANTTDSWKIQFGYKIDVSGSQYIMGYPWMYQYLEFGTNSITLFLANVNKRDFTNHTEAIRPKAGICTLEYDGNGNWKCTITDPDGGKPAAYGETDNAQTISATAKELTGLQLIGGHRNTGGAYSYMTGYLRDFKFWKNGTLTLDIPDLYTGMCNVMGVPFTANYSGSRTRRYVPAQPCSTTLDADGFTPTHPQTGGQAIPGTYLSLPYSEALAASAALTGNVWFDGTTPQAVAVEALIHWTPSHQYYDWLDRKNLFIVSSGETIDSSTDKANVALFNDWTAYIADDYVTNNPHMSAANKAIWKAQIEALLHPDYEFTSGGDKGYYFDTYGPNKAYSRYDSRFCILMYYSGLMSTGAAIPLGAGLTGTPRINVNGAAYDSKKYTSAHNTGTEVWFVFITSTNNFTAPPNEPSGIQPGNSITRAIPAIAHRPMFTSLTISTANTIEPYDVGDYPVAAHMTQLLPPATAYGEIPGIDGVLTLGYGSPATALDIGGKAIRDFAFTEIGIAISKFASDTYKNCVTYDGLNNILAQLLAYFTANAPTDDFVFDVAATTSFTYDPQQPHSTGVWQSPIEDDAANPYVTQLQALFTAAGYTFTVDPALYFSTGIDGNADPGALSGGGCVVFTHDDIGETVVTVGAPVFQEFDTETDYINNVNGGRLMRSTAYVTPNTVGNGYASWDQLKTMWDNGFDIQDHTQHMNEGAIAAADAIWDSKLAFFGTSPVYGAFIRPEHLSYPLGQYDAASVADLQNSGNPTRKTGRTVMRGFNGADNGPTTTKSLDAPLYELKCITLDSTMGYNPMSDIERVKAAMLTAKQGGYALFLLTHHFPVNSTDDPAEPLYKHMGSDSLRELLQFCVDNEIPTKTVRQLYEEETGTGGSWVQHLPGA